MRPIISKKPSEQNRAEVDVPGLVIDLLEADMEAAEDLADPEPLGVPANAPVAANLTDLVVSGVDEVFEVLRVRPVRGPIEFRRDFHLECLMRPLVVELMAERVEAFLLRA